MADFFFASPHQLASFYTAPQWHDAEKHGKYLPGGLKPIEAFCNDIYDNLVCWAYEGNSIFYRTKDFWYVFELQTEGNMKGAITMTRFRNGGWDRMDSWANAHSINVGKKFLANHKDKQVPLFNVRS